MPEENIAMNPSVTIQTSESPENQTNVTDLITEGIIFDPWLA